MMRMQNRYFRAFRDVIGLHHNQRCSLQEVSTIKALLNLELERARTKKLYDVFSTAFKKVELLEHVSFGSEPDASEIRDCTSAFYGHMARASSVRSTLQHAPHRVGMPKLMRLRQSYKW